MRGIYTLGIIKSSFFYIFIGLSLFLIKKRKTSAVDIYIPEIVAICSIEKPLSIKKPNRAVPNAVENTIKAVVNAFIDPIYLTP
tara:strand:+ start:308 stop:559 length:252 start_codon:yes stop_codon:yes gene_type:complete